MQPASKWPAAAHDIIIGGPQPTFNVIPQNTISGNTQNGINIGGTAHDIFVNHSYIGTGIDGLTALGNVASGISIAGGAYSVTIGSTDPNLRTVIAGNGGNGISLNGTHDNTVLGAYIGVDRTGVVAVGNGGDGINIVASSNNLFGGTASEDQNTIANNAASGILVQSRNGNTILHNSIYANAAPGISLSAGANHDQAAPHLTSVQVLSSTIRVSGTLDSTPNTAFTIELFATSTSGAQGRYFLGVLEAKTNPAGHATFTFTGALPPAGANFITATATDLSFAKYLQGMPGGLRRISDVVGGGNTSEFSNAVS